MENAVSSYEQNNMQNIAENETSNLTPFNNMYQKASLLTVTEKEQKALEAPLNPDEVEIRPDGLIYYPQVFYREKLNSIFGIGQWALIQHSISKIGNTLCFDGSLYVRGCFVSRALGEHEYYENNRNTSWASVYEAAKSDCLVRCCKDLGIAKELWQPAYGRDWVKKYAVKVFVEVKDRQTGKTETKAQWRRKDADPFWNEKGIVPGSKYEPPQQKKSHTTPAAQAEAPQAGTFTEAEPQNLVDSVRDTLPKLNNLSEIKDYWEEIFPLYNKLPVESKRIVNKEFKYYRDAVKSSGLFH
ncbi:MAG: hypothetical protein HF314_04715 [Ignavibacteria bacterium]|jgi:hypothetical protein|nr:hypothetical protein [Ignavibacteria bacterium]MCU7502352.1 hypothetical protein [Ignavibacteria bacterium]MCU7515083.1 hypothetical protein [Ignavibacteria bacterium]